MYIVLFAVLIKIRLKITTNGRIKVLAPSEAKPSHQQSMGFFFVAVNDSLSLTIDNDFCSVAKT